MGECVSGEIVVVGEHRIATTAGGHALGARAGRRPLLPGAPHDGAASSVLVAPSLLLTSRLVVASAAQARGRTVTVVTPVRAAGFRVTLDPAHVFLTSPALGWTLVGIVDRGLPTMRLGSLPGLVLPALEQGAEASRGAGRWVAGARIVADLDRRLQVLGGRGAWLRHRLGLW